MTYAEVVSLLKNYFFSRLAWEIKNIVQSFIWQYVFFSLNFGKL